jgi:hypothetical protein
LLIEEDREAFDRKRWPKGLKKPRSRDRFWGATNPFDEMGQVEIRRTIDELKESYEAVIKFGDLAFRIENWLRVHASE